MSLATHRHRFRCAIQNQVGRWVGRWDPPKMSAESMAVDVEQKNLGHMIQVMWSGWWCGRIVIFPYFSIYWECHNPNSLKVFFVFACWNHQPAGDVMMFRTGFTYVCDDLREPNISKQKRTATKPWVTETMEWQLVPWSLVIGFSNPWELKFRCSMPCLGTKLGVVWFCITWMAKTPKKSRNISRSIAQICNISAIFFARSLRRIPDTISTAWTKFRKWLRSPTRLPGRTSKPWWRAWGRAMSRWCPSSSRMLRGGVPMGTRGIAIFHGF